MSGPPRLIALSLKARGLAAKPPPPGQLAPAAYLLKQGRHAWTELVDLSIAVATNILLLSSWLGWTTWGSVVLNILWCVFFIHYKDVQAQVAGLYALHSGLGSCGAPQLLAQLDDAASDTMLQLSAYLAHPRDLASRHFSPGILRGEQVPANSPVLLLGRDIGQRLRALHACLRRLCATAGSLLEHVAAGSTAGGALQPQAISLLQLVVSLSTAVHALAAAKDARSPLLLRVTARTACVLLAPMLTASWLAGASITGRPITSAGEVFAIVVGCILQLLLMSLYSVGVMLEDPFDCGPASPPDSISLLEFNHALAFLTAPPAPEDEPGAEAPSSEVLLPVSSLTQQPQQQQPAAPGGMVLHAPAGQAPRQSDGSGAFVAVTRAPSSSKGTHAIGEA